MIVLLCEALEKLHQKLLIKQRIVVSNSIMGFVVLMCEPQSPNRAEVLEQNGQL